MKSSGYGKETPRGNMFHPIINKPLAANKVDNKSSLFFASNMQDEPRLRKYNTILKIKFLFFIF